MDRWRLLFGKCRCGVRWWWTGDKHNIPKCSCGMECEVEKPQRETVSDTEGV